jgi:hypothetical protein
MQKEMDYADKRAAEVDVILSGLESGILENLANSTVLVPQDMKKSVKSMKSVKSVNSKGAKSEVKTERTIELA